jgi:hypothetical protein
MDEPVDALPPYPGVAFPAGTNFPPPAGPPAWPPAGSAPPPPPPARRWPGFALAGGAVLLAVGAFLLGHVTARAASPASVADATTLNALTSATSAATNASCTGPRRVAAGTLKAVSGTTLTITNPKGATVTVKTDSSTKVTKVVAGTLGDVTTGATVAVHGAASGATITTIAADQVAIIPATSATPFAGPRPFGRVAPAAPNAPAPAKMMGAAIGTVQSVTGSGFTLSSGGRTITVTTSSSTVFSETVTANVSDLVVGQPIAAGGTPNSDGSITASNIEQATVKTGLGTFPGLGFGPAVGAARRPFARPAPSTGG